MFQGVERVQAYLSEHRGVYPCVNFYQETKKMDGANRLVKELTSQNVLDSLDRTASPDFASGFKNVGKIVGLLGRAGDHLGLGTDLLVAFGFKEKRVMKELDELSKNISLMGQEMDKPDLLTQSKSTSLWRFWLIHDKVLSTVLQFEQSVVHDHHPLPGSDRDRETYCKRLGHMVQAYSPTQVIIDLRHMHCLIMGEPGFGKPLFKQLAEEACMLENEELDKFLGPFLFFFQSVIALQVRAVRMLLSFIMYEQEDTAIYERDLVAIAKNVVLQMGERSNPVYQFKWYINFKAFGEQNAIIASVKWPGWYAYVDNTSNMRGWKETAGEQGLFKIEPHHGGTFLITTGCWKDYYVYMDSSAFSNVRACKGDPGNQGYWKINFKDISTRTFTLTPVEYPNYYMHMESNAWGNLSGKKDELDDSCYFKLRVEPVGHGANGIELADQS